MAGKETDAWPDGSGEQVVAVAGHGEVQLVGLQEDLSCLGADRATVRGLLSFPEQNGYQFLTAQSSTSL